MLPELIQIHIYLLNTLFWWVCIRVKRLREYLISKCVSVSYKTHLLYSLTSSSLSRFIWTNIAVEMIYLCTILLFKVFNNFKFNPLSRNFQVPKTQNYRVGLPEPEKFYPSQHWLGIDAYIWGYVVVCSNRCTSIVKHVIVVVYLEWCQPTKQ